MGARLQSQYGEKPLGGESLTIGSSADNQLVLNDPQTAPRHAEIRPQGQSYWIMDHGSAHGTLINGQPLPPNTPRQLQPGDRIQVGNIVFSYEVDDASPATVAAPVNMGAMGNPATPPTIGMGQHADTTTPEFVGSGPPLQGYGVPAAPIQTQRPGQQFPDYTQAPKRGNMRMLVIALVVVVVLVGGFLVFSLLNKGGGNGPAVTVNKNATSTAVSVASTTASAGTATAAVATDTASIETTLNTYCAAVKTDNAHAAYQLLSSDSQKTVSEPEFTLLFKFAKGKIKSCTVSNVQVQGSTATATVTITTTDGKTQTENENLVKENGVWKLKLRNQAGV